MAGFQLVTPTKLGQASIGTVNTLIYTVPGSTVAYVKDIDIANNTTTSISVILYIGNGVAQSNILIPNITIPANSILQWTGTQILNAADTINAVASAPGCTITISGGQAV